MITILIGCAIGFFVPVTIVIIVTALVLDKQGLELKKKTRYKRRTYDDGFGKYIVDVKEEEWITVPKDENKK